MYNTEENFEWYTRLYPNSKEEELVSLVNEFLKRKQNQLNYDPAIKLSEKKKDFHLLNSIVKLDRGVLDSFENEINKCYKAFDPILNKLWEYSLEVRHESQNNFRTYLTDEICYQDILENLKVYHYSLSCPRFPKFINQPINGILDDDVLSSRLNRINKLLYAILKYKKLMESPELDAIDTYHLFFEFLMLDDLGKFVPRKKWYTEEQLGL